MSKAQMKVTVTAHKGGRKAYHTTDCYHLEQIDNPIEKPIEDVDVKMCNLCRGEFEKAPEGEVFVAKIYKHYHLYKCRNARVSDNLTTRNRICMERSRAELCGECATIQESLK